MSNFPTDFTDRWEAYRFAIANAGLPPRSGGYSLQFILDFLEEVGRTDKRRITFGQTINTKSNGFDFDIEVNIHIDFIQGEFEPEELQSIANDIQLQLYGFSDLLAFGIEENPSDFNDKTFFADSAFGSRNNTASGSFNSNLDFEIEEIE